MWKKNHFEIVSHSKTFDRHIPSIILNVIDQIVNSNDTNLPELLVNIRKSVDNKITKIKCNYTAPK